MRGMRWQIACVLAESLFARCHRTLFGDDRWKYTKPQSGGQTWRFYRQLGAWSWLLPLGWFNQYRNSKCQLHQFQQRRKLTSKVKSMLPNLSCKVTLEVVFANFNCNLQTLFDFDTGWWLGNQFSGSKSSDYIRCLVESIAWRNSFSLL